MDAESEVKSLDKWVAKLRASNKDTKCCDGYPYCYCDEMTSELEYDTIKHQDKVDVGLKQNNIVNPVNSPIVNPIHNPDAPSTEEEIERMWRVTRSMCK